MRLREIALRRLGAQQISASAFTRAEELVMRLGAIQAQDYLGALWAIGLRLKEARLEDVERAAAERTIVRTWPMRGTLHFVAAADARWMTELLSPRPVAAAAGRLHSFGIDRNMLSRARRVLTRKLRDGQRLTRPAVYSCLEDAGIATGKQRGLHILWRLAQECFVCFGPRSGKQQTFVLFEEWLPHARSLPLDEALARLAHTYFRGHGPATLSDFVWWTGLKTADARRAIGLVGGDLKEEVVNGRSYWTLGDGHNSGVYRVAPQVLPAFDEFLVGYSDRSAAIVTAQSKRVSTGGILYPTVIVNGQVVGTWRRRIEGHDVVCSVIPFKRLSPATAKSVERALRRYAQFLGLNLRRENKSRA